MTKDEISKLSTPTPPHTDHPLRHWDRTCPACNPPDDKAGRSQNSDVRSQDGNNDKQCEPDAWLHHYKKPGRQYTLADLGEHGPDPEEGFKHYAKKPLYLSTPSATVATDAARYRWARQQNDDTLLMLYLDLPANSKPEELDTAIDGAMASSDSSGHSGD